MHTVIGRPAFLAQLEPELTAYNTLTGSVSVPFAGSTIADLQAQLANSGASSLFLLGDLPTVVRYDNLYGHGDILEPHDGEILPGVPVGRVDFSTSWSVDPVARTKAYLQRFCDDRTQTSADLMANSPPLRSYIMDHFSNQYQFYAPTDLQFNGLPKALRDIHYFDDPLQSWAQGPGPAMQSPPGLFLNWFAGGGVPWEGAYECDYVTCLNANRIAKYIGMYGSHLFRVNVAPCGASAMLAWDTPLVVLMNRSGNFPWFAFLQGVPIGQCLSYSTYTWLLGSPLVTLRPEIVELVK